MSRNLENLYIPVNRGTNDNFREGYDGISWDNEYPEEIKKKAMERVLKQFKGK